MNANNFQYDFCVIGGGSGGVRAARTAAGLGARVCLIEQGALGGTCVNVGCIPKKLLMYASEYREHLEDSRNYGWKISSSSFVWSQLLKNKNLEINRLNGVYETILRNSDVEIVKGHAALKDAHTVRVEDREISAAFILIATGSRPAFPDFPGIDHTFSSNEAFYLEELPRRLAIVGGGYVACEFASIFNGLGVELHQIMRASIPLVGFDSDISLTLADEMKKRGVHQHFRSKVERITKTKHGLEVELSDGTAFCADGVMMATGRKPNVQNMGLEEVGVALKSNGQIQVDAYGQSSVDSIYAVGDVCNDFGITPVALHEGMAVAHTLFGEQLQKMDHQFIPTAVFSQPAVGAVGLTEQEAKERYPNIDIYRSRFKPLKHTISGRDEKSMVKLVVDRDSDRVLGCHVVGHEAGEVIQGFAVALRSGANKNCFDRTVGVHPTLAEELVTLRQVVDDA